MLRCARRSVGLLQRFHVKHAQYFLFKPTFTFVPKSVLFNAKKFSTEVPQLKWEVAEDTTSPAFSVDTPTTSEPPFEPLDRGVIFAFGFTQEKQGENAFIESIINSENTKILDGIAIYGIDIKDHYGNMPIHLAAASGNVDTIKLLLSLGADINAKNYQGLTPLFVAAYSGATEACSFLIENGARKDVKDESGHTALHYAAWMGTGETVKLLVIKYNFDIQARSNILRTPLHYCTANQDTCKTLIELGAKPDEPDAEGCTPMHFVAAEDGVTVKILAQAGANVNRIDNQGFTPIFHSAHQGFIQPLRDLIECGAKVNEISVGDGTTPLVRAAMSGKLDCVALLLENGADVNGQSNRGQTPLHYAVTANQIEVVRYLLAKGASTELADKEKGNTPLQFAVQNEECEEMIETLVKGGANVNGTNTNRPIIMAAKVGRLDAIVKLVSLGASVDAKGRSGETALFHAIHRKRLDCAEWLIKHGANPKEKRNDECTIMHFASCVQAVDMLVKEGVPVNSVSSDGVTPLHLVARSGNIEVMEKLISLGANVNAYSRKLGSVLTVATDAKNLRETVRCLFKLGAKIHGDPPHMTSSAMCFALTGEAIEALIEEGGVDVNEVIPGNATALSVAAHTAREDVVTALVKHGADVNLAPPSGNFPLILSLVTSSNITDESTKLKIARILLDHGADKNAESNEKITALHLLAGCYTDTSLVKDLIPEKGIDTKTTGLTALFMAASKGSVEMVKELLRLGADPEVLNGDSKLTAKEIAQRKGFPDVVEILENWKKIEK